MVAVQTSDISKQAEQASKRTTSTIIAELRLNPDDYHSTGCDQEENYFDYKEATMTNCIYMLTTPRQQQT
eukprot:2620525-Amphidinium_carterae.1